MIKKRKKHPTVSNNYSVSDEPHFVVGDRVIIGAPMVITSIISLDAQTKHYEFVVCPGFTEDDMILYDKKIKNNIKR